MKETLASSPGTGGCIRICLFESNAFAVSCNNYHILEMESKYIEIETRLEAHKRYAVDSSVTSEHKRRQAKAIQSSRE